MKIKHAGLTVVFSLAVAALATTAQAAEQKASGQAAPKVTWVHPVIPGFGGVHPRPDVDMQLDPTADYKVFVDVVSGPPKPGVRYDALGRLARLVNLMGYAKVPPEHVHIVALLEGNVGSAVLTDAAYERIALKFDPEHAKKGMKNPNLPLLRALKKAGVKLMVCSQALAEYGVPDSDVDPSVTITLSGLTDPVIYGQRGYTFMQL